MPIISTDIKMRTIKNPDAVCKICGATRKQSIEIFEIMFTEKAKLTICDLCNDKILYKTLKASCLVNDKPKSKEIEAVLNMRKSKGIPTWYFDEPKRK